MINATFESEKRLEASFQRSSELNAEMHSTVYVPVMNDYTGAYEITPSDNEQVLQTEDLHMIHNLIVNPIPSNYGRITYNGTYITVS